ncbi:unnamed protein product [Auanema sp. JU1783]|nr:unnamed protein product [Auanema sp. JU1783]
MRSVEGLHDDFDCAPSTSNAGEPRPVAEATAREEEIVKMWMQMDEKLEENARQHNLSTFNVKSILHHFIKNPSTLAMFMGIADGASSSGLPSVKITRSKVKKEDCMNELKLKPVNTTFSSKRPHSFLDLSYDDEEDDEDYQPSESNADEAAASEADDTSLEGDASDNQEEMGSDVTLTEEVVGMSVENDKGYELRSRTSNLNDAAIHDELADSNNEIIMTRESDVFLNVDDCYREFLCGLQEAETKQDNNLDVGDDDDTDYNPQEDLEFEKDAVDKEEVMVNRFTEIPRREVEGMFRDLLDEKTIKETMPALIPIETASLSVLDKLDEKKRARRSQHFVKTAEVPVYNDSCTLLNESIPVYFRKCEYDQLLIQLEQHVQLLTQGVVLCNNDPKLFSTKDKFQQMINELDEKYYEYGVNSFYNILNLEGSIKTCHDILKIKEVSPADVKWANSIFRIGFYPRPEACVALSRSEAIIYPKLVPLLQPVGDHSASPFCSPFFSPCDNLLLALGLLQFGHVPNASRKDYAGRYYMITKHVLRNKSTSQIRNHLKNVRARRDSNILYKIIADAEDGYPNLNISPTAVEKVEDVMSKWPDSLKPVWFNEFWKVFELESMYLIRKIPIAPIPPLLPKSSSKKADKKSKQPGEISKRSSRASSTVSSMELRCYTPGSREASQTPARCVPINMPNNGAIIVGSPSVGYQLINISEQQMFFVSNPDDSMKIPLDELIKTQSEGILEETLTLEPSDKQEEKPVSPPKKSSKVDRKPPTRKRVRCSSREKSPPVKKRPLSVVSDQSGTMSTRSRGKRGISPILKDSPTPLRTRSALRKQKQASVVVESVTEPEKDETFMEITPEPVLVTPSLEPRTISAQSLDSDVLPATNSLASGTISVCSSISQKINDEMRSVSSLTPTTSEMDGLQRQNMYSSTTDYSGYILPTPREHSRVEMNSCIPRTPIPRTPSDSSISSPLCLSLTKSEICENTVIPLTPRDDDCSQSPSIPIQKHNLFSKAHMYESTSQAVRSLFSQVDSDSCSSKENYFGTSEPSHYIPAEVSNNVYEGICEAANKSFEDDCDELTLGSSMQHSDEVRTAVDDIRKRGKKRTREERNTDGCWGMLNTSYRNRQESAVAKKIVADVKQRLSMHNEVYSQVERIMSCSLNQKGKIAQLQQLLSKDHSDVLCLLSLFVEPESLTKQLLKCPLRKSYKDAFNILYSIDAYVTYAKLRPSSKFLFRSISKIDNISNNIYGFLQDIFENEKPLWSYLKKFSTLPFDDSPNISDYEFVDLTKKDELSEEKHYECISDLSEIIGTAPSKKGTKLQVNGDYLYSLNGNSYVSTKVKFSSENRKIEQVDESLMYKSPPQSPSGKRESIIPWKKAEDLSLLTTYTGLDGEITNALPELSKLTSRSEDEVRSRIQFLLSFV